jgi:hypothetical protein
MITFIIVAAISIAAALFGPLIIRAKRRQYRGPKVLRYDNARGCWVATYRRLR